MKKLLVLIIAALIAVPGAYRKLKAVRVTTKTLIETGKASYYGRAHHGKLTSSGIPFDMHKLTAASKYLPFGTQVEVVNKITGASVWVTITDRGPYCKGRVIDLSHAAAQSIGILETGSAPVAIYQWRTHEMGRY